MKINQHSLNKKIISKSEKETIAAGRELTRDIHSGKIIGLEGNLGSGKTVFVKGLAEGIGCTASEVISSPTFKLFNTYTGRILLYHIDLYRLVTVEEIIQTGILDLLTGESLIAIEWAEKIKPLMIDFDYYVQFEYISDKKRRIKIKSPSA